MKICRKCTTEVYFCLVNVTLQFNYPLYFRKELIKELLKSTHSLILIERLHKNQYFFSGGTDKDEYITGRETLLPDQCRLIDKVRFTYSLLGDASQKQIETIEE